jgi:putative aldouronate transport system permease protein
MAEDSIIVNYKSKPPLRKQSKIIKELVKNRALFLMLLPALILMLLLNYLPMLGTLVAFKDFNT